VIVAVITDGGPDAGSGASAEQGAKMGAAYLNRYAGGLGGHMINLYICGNRGTSAGARACATDVVRKGAVAVTVPSTDQGASEVPPIVQAGIPFITLMGMSTPELTMQGAFAIEGGLPAELGALALHAKHEHDKKVVLFVPDQAAAVQSAQVLGLQEFARAGVGFAVVPAGTDEAAIKQQLHSAVSGGASAIGLLGDAALCRSFLQASEAAVRHLPRYVFDTCLDPSIERSPSLDRLLKGSWLVGASAATAKDDALYAAMVHMWAPGADPTIEGSVNQAAGLVPILTLAALTNGSSRSSGLPVASGAHRSALTASTVMHEARSAPRALIPLSGGQTFHCDGTAFRRLPSVCSSSAAVGLVGSGNAVSHVQVYDASSLF
jgi:branched-chain amino acid transport system substrate-binding protein